jgi:hypothetical protein
MRLLHKEYGRMSRNASPRVSPTASPPGDDDLATGMSRMLRELALPLLQAGITPKRIAEIAANAFVEAACGASTMRNGRVNQSRVAVLTGLSRAEVRRLMRCKPAPSAVQQSRTARVIDGWMSDRRFLNTDGCPRVLKIRGRGNTFLSLVKLFAGDVPYRAVLEELRNLNAVEETDSCVKLTEFRGRGRRRLTRRLETIFPLLIDGIGVAAQEDSAPSSMPMFRVTLDASDSRNLAVIEERADTSAKAWLSGLRESLVQTGKARAGRGSSRRVTVTVLVRKHESTHNSKR